MSTPLYAILIGLGCAFIGGIAQLLFKIGSNRLELNIKSLLKNWQIILGLALYGLSAVLFIFALRVGELSILYPTIATTYIWVNFLAAKYLKEGMNTHKWGGVLLILIGVALIGLS